MGSGGGSGGYKKEDKIHSYSVRKIFLRSCMNLEEEIFRFPYGYFLHMEFHSAGRWNFRDLFP